MLNKSKYVALICGAVSIGVTVIFYLMAFNNIFTVPMRWTSLVFLILSECIFTIKAFIVKRTIFNISNVVTSSIHIIFVLMISVLFVNLFPLFIKKYVLLNVLALCVLLVVDVTIVYFGNYVAMHNTELGESQSVMQCCMEKAVSLHAKYGDTDYKKSLQEIVELLKYSDNSCLSDDEITIMNKLDEVEQLLVEDDADAIDGKLSDIKNVIKLRSIKVAGAKRGKY